MQNTSFSIYDASAGSGKTYTLVKEYLKILFLSKRNDAYRNILAITFTNKAVQEMKSRIIKNLFEITKENPAEKSQFLMQDLSIETGLNIIQLRTKAQQILKHLIHNYAAFDILTIDKFTHKVIRAFAFDLNLPLSFEITTDTDLLLGEAVDAVISQAGEKETLTKLLIDFTMEKIDDDKSWDISREILETGKLILNENHRSEINKFKDISIEKFIVFKKKMLSFCKTLEKDSSEKAVEIFDLIEKNDIDLKSFSGQYFPNHLNSIKNKTFNRKNKIYKDFNDIRILKNSKDTALIENIIPEMLSILSEIYTKMGKKDLYKALLKNITPLSLLSEVRNELTKIQIDKNTVSISEFNSIIHKEIQNQPAPFIYERIGERYRHFFIDEFQDTSEMQWQNLIPLINNSLAGQDEYGTKGTLMIVGDPKQSIYRWRGGKAEQFIALSKKECNPFSNPDKELFHLGKNFRSYSEVIEFNNSFFKFNSKYFINEDYCDLYKNHSSQLINDKIGGIVSISFIPKTDNSEKTDDDKVSENEAPEKIDLYLEATLQTIQKVLQQGFEYLDIAIITRKKQQGIDIANFLTENNIPIISSETLVIHNSTEVKVLIYLLRYLNNNSDKEAKSLFLYYIAANRQCLLPIHDFVANGIGIENEKEFEQWLSQIDIFISFENLRKKSLYETVTILTSSVLRQSHTESGGAYIQYFLDVVLERNILVLEGITDFLDFWQKKGESFSIPLPEGKNAVQIMTIHKSKGLEFPIVIFPFAEESYSNIIKDKLWLSPEAEEFGELKFLANQESSVTNFGDTAQIVYEEIQQETLLDKMNVLYVALTRAEEQLYIISSMNIKNNGDIVENNMSSFFINYLVSIGIFAPEIMNYEFGSPNRLSVRHKTEDSLETIAFLENFLNFKNIKIAAREAMMWGSKRQEAIEYGNTVHEILSTISTEKDIILAVEKSIEQGFINQNQKEQILKTIQEIVLHQDLEPFFSNENETLNEQIIIREKDGFLKPDKMVLTKNNEVYLLDYKTGIPDKKHELQLQDYTTAIENIGFEVKKKCLVYIGQAIKIVNL